jgi:hypothetical protein
MIAKLGQANVLVHRSVSGSDYLLEVNEAFSSSLGTATSRTTCLMGASDEPFTLMGATGIDTSSVLEFTRVVASTHMKAEDGTGGAPDKLSDS